MKVRDIDWRQCGPVAVQGDVAGVVRFTIATSLADYRTLRLHMWKLEREPVEVADVDAGKKPAAEWLAEFVSQFVEED